MDDIATTLPPSSRMSDMRPITFNGLHGWLHTPRGSQADAGVVLVSPFGRDARCVHMPMRLLAEKFAAAGFPVLRYDHLGTGDSLDGPTDQADMLPLWIEGMEHAAAALRAHGGVRRIIMGGARLGATLAMIGAKVDGHILLAPVLNGRSWLNRLRFSARIGGKRGQPQGAEQPLDADGLWLPAATAASLALIDLTAATPPQGPVFVAAQNRLVSTYADSLLKAGAMVETTDFPGFNELFLEPAINIPPELVFDRACDWLSERFSGLAPASPTAPGSEPTLQQDGAIEHAVTFGDGLHGVFCEPERKRENAPAALFFNTGGDPRSGPGGVATQAARRLARHGVSSLRFDFSGLGDSPMPGAETRCHVFETAREGEMDAAVDFLAARGYAEVVTVGVCSGAYHAVRQAWRDPRVSGVFAVSPVKIQWRPGDSVTFARDEYRMPFKTYAKGLFAIDGLKKAINARIDAFAFLTALANRLRDRVFGWIDRRRPDAPLASMRRFAERGGRAMFVMGVNDTSMEEIETHFGRNGIGLTRLRNVSVEVVPELDHGLSWRRSREIAIDRLAAWLAP